MQAPTQDCSGDDHGAARWHCSAGATVVCRSVDESSTEHQWLIRGLRRRPFLPGLTVCLGVIGLFSLHAADYRHSTAFAGPHCNPDRELRWHRAGSPATRSCFSSEPRRREVSALLLTGGLHLGGVVAGQPASAVDVGMIVAESRKNAEDQKKVKGIWNPESYKVNTQNYNATNLKTFLPTVFLGRRAFEGILKQLSNPKANLTQPEVFNTIRDQNREKPISRLRKEAFRTKTWVEENTRRGTAATTAYERIKRALDDQDTQLLLLSRTETRIDSAAVKVAKRNVEAILDAIDQLIDTVPEKEAEVGRAISARRAIPVVRIPLQDKYNTSKILASAQNATSTSGGSAAS